MPQNPRASLNWITAFIATGGFSGYAPAAPGTAGAFVCAVLAWFILPEVTLASGAGPVWVALLSMAAFVSLAVWSAGAAEPVYGKDASRIVIDEFAGFILAIAFLPKTLLVYVAAFLLFRVLDIVKPFPARRLESVPGGLGIVLDDVVAGVYANVLIRIMLLVRGF